MLFLVFGLLAAAEALSNCVAELGKAAVQVDKKLTDHDFKDEETPEELGLTEFNVIEMILIMNEDFGYKVDCFDVSCATPFGRGTFKEFGTKWTCGRRSVLADAVGGVPAMWLAVPLVGVAVLAAAGAAIKAGGAKPIVNGEEATLIA